MGYACSVQCPSATSSSRRGVVCGAADGGASSGLLAGRQRRSPALAASRSGRSVQSAQCPLASRVECVP